MNLIVSIIGKQNSGKSTLFNKLTKKRRALVSKDPGFTSDRQYLLRIWKKRKFIFIDTPSIYLINKKSKFNNQSIIAIEESHVILLVIRYESYGSLDNHLSIIAFLKRNKKNFFVILNLDDNFNKNYNFTDKIYFLGIDKICYLNFLKENNFKKIFKNILYPEHLSSFKESNKNNKVSSAIKNLTLNKIEMDKYPKIAIIGRPNSGKSTLMNCILRQNRSTVSNSPGTTKDVLYSLYSNKEKTYLFIDTAGLVKKKNFVHINKSVIKNTLNVIKKIDVSILVIDSCVGITKQDLFFLNYILKYNKSLIIAVNKLDLISKKNKKEIKEKIIKKISFFKFIKIHFISAICSFGINNLLYSIKATYKNKLLKFETSKLTRILRKATFNNQPPMLNGIRSKLKYAHPGGYNPLVIVIHGIKVISLPKNYISYLKKFFIKELNIIGTSLKIKFISSINPYSK
ncbi:b2511 [Wigglesworthia glossinidia endosymbiont of Glossina brevipalpis]|uniref:GTPase Der n=1 Tax=Wigglesworthia glossinidia brevipalpis TaxID=36870 RepID=Q8D1Y0_WIGBR|nr:b2511 [Wigglesworthia glossinidia endosymbiont of Glossina brevipalpis]